MFKARQKIVSIVVAFCALVVMAVLGFTTMAMPVNTIASAAGTTDTLTRSITGATGTSYVTWSGKTLASGAVYAGQSAGGNSSIQLRSSNSNSGIVTTESGGKAVKVTVVWNSNTSSGRTLDIYGKTSAYSQATDLYNSSKQGTKLGSIKYGTSTELTISGDYTYIGMRSNSGAMYLTSISIEWASACEHTSTTTTTTDATCTTDGSTIEKCNDCGAEVSKTVIPATGHVNKTTTTTDADCVTDGSIVVTCDDCGAEVSNEVIPALGHDFAAPIYEREGDQHTATGTCNVCGETTSETEDCTLDYEYSSNENRTHNTTSTCSVCSQSATTENEECSFGEGVLNEFIYTYTCEYCEYSYEEAATTYTVTYVVPNGIKAVDAAIVVENATTELPEAGTVEGYTFEGWVEETLNEKTEAQPTTYKAGASYIVTEDITFYALYSYTEGTGAWTKVTDAGKLAVDKEIVIVASGSDYALGTTQNNNNRASVAVTKSNDTVVLTNDVQIITLEAGTVANTFAFNVGNGYLYAASSGSNHLKTQTKNDNNGSWTISIAESGVATIKAQGTNTRNWLRFNSSNNPKIFSCYGSGQNDVSIYMKDGATYYVTEFNTCAHENVNEVIEEATCTESGSRTVTCLDCEAVLEAEILEAIGHNFIDDVCEHCEKLNPASIVYDGYYYLSLNNKYAGEKDGNYYKLFDFTPSETVELAYVFYFVNNGETYDMYYLANGQCVKGVTITTQEDYTVHITNSEGRILSHNTGYSTYQRMGFYATSSNYPNAITLTAVELPANIDGASLTIGEEITLNYKVTMSDAFAESRMKFTIEDDVIEVEGKKGLDGRYVFSIGLPPQYMATNVKAELVFNGITIDMLENYSVKEYAQNKLNDVDSADELKKLVSALLYYGAASQNYRSYNLENLATDDVENLVSLSNVPESTDFALENNPEVDVYSAWFTAANVKFSNDNQIYVKINTTENVTLKIDGVEVDLQATGTTIYTDAILATGFANIYTFELYYEGVLMQTLTYSVNAYAYAMKDNANMSDLALALYNYGAAAEAYANA